MADTDNADPEWSTPISDDVPGLPRRLVTLRGIIRYAIGFLIVGFLYWAVQKNASVLRGHDLHLSLTAGLLSVAAGLAASVASAWSWWAVLRTLGVNCSFRAASHVWYSSMVARYVPGTLPGIAYRIYLTTRIGVSRPVAAAATVLDWVCWLVSATLAAVVTAPWWIQAGVHHRVLTPAQLVIMALAIPLGFALLHPACIGFLIRKASRKAGAISLPPMTYRQALRLLPIYLVKWPFYGLSLAVFLPTVSGILGSAVQTPVSSGAFSLGWIAGFVSPFAPGGLGVREGIIVAVLHTLPGVALQAALLSRLSTTLAEALCWIWAIVDGRLRPLE